MIKNSKFCSLRFHLNEDGHEEFGDPSVKETNSFKQVEISEVLLCDGLLLLRVTRDNNVPSLMVWNPYLGQTRLIQPRTAYLRDDVYALGYDNSKNRNHKILRIFHNLDKRKVECEIYDLKYDSWRVLDLTLPLGIYFCQRSASVKGNTYFLTFGESDDITPGFDFTTERFGHGLVLPEPRSDFYSVRSLFSLREEKLVASYMNQRIYGVGIWVTTNIEPNEVLWSSFLKVDLEAIPRYLRFQASGFFIDEEKKLAVVFGRGDSEKITKTEKTFYNEAYIIGENEFLKTVDLGETDFYLHYFPVVCSNSYVPSLQQI